LNLDIHGYKSEHLFGNKSRNTTKGRFSGGLSIYFKERLNNDLSVINTQAGIMWIILSKQLFNFDEDIFICNTYILPTSSPLFNQNEFDFLNN